MGRKTIHMTLSEAGIDQAMQELETYIQDLKSKTDRLRDLIAERIAWSAAEGFSSAIADDIFTGGERPSGNVSVTMENTGEITVVIASGTDAVFIEFGAGVYYNGSAGSSPHPDGAAMGFLIGEYGKGYGKRNAWALPGSTKANPILSHGTPAVMPMYHGVQDAIAVIGELAQEVFR